MEAGGPKAEVKAGQLLQGSGGTPCFPNAAAKPGPPFLIMSSERIICSMAASADMAILTSSELLLYSIFSQ